MNKGLLVAVSAGLAAGLWLLARRRGGGRRSVEFREVGGPGNAKSGSAQFPAVLVTGGTGFVGRWVLEALAAGGQRLIISFDSRAPPAEERVPGVFYIVGSLLEKGHLERAMRGRNVRSVIHVAGIKSFVGTTIRQLWAVNVEGTRAVIAACKEMGVRHLVYTSSLTVAMDPTAPPERNVLMSRDAPYARKPLDDYARTKVAAEKLVLAANEAGLQTVNEAGLQTVSLRPAAIYGPGDNAIFDPICVKSDIPTFGDGSHAWDWVSVMDVASAHVHALEALEAGRAGVAGHAFMVGQGETMVYRDVFLCIGNFIHKGGQTAPALPIPLAKFLARMQALIHRLTGIITFHASMTVPSINFTQVDWSVDIGPTRQHLGYAPAHPSTVQTIRAMVKSKGLLLPGA